MVERLDHCESNGNGKKVGPLMKYEPPATIVKLMLLMGSTKRLIDERIKVGR